VQGETSTDMSLLQSSHMVPFTMHNTIIPGTSQPHHVFDTAPPDVLLILYCEVFV